MTEPQLDWLTVSAAVKRRRDAGIRKASEHAEDKSAGWNERAFAELKHFVAQRHGAPFLAEQFVQWVQFKIPAAPDGRAFGGVMQRAAREGVVVKAGYGLASTSNGSPKVLWKGV